jgi:hypothetical protein
MLILAIFNSQINFDTGFWLVESTVRLHIFCSDTEFSKQNVWHEWIDTLYYFYLELVIWKFTNYAYCIANAICVWFLLKLVHKHDKRSLVRQGIGWNMIDWTVC